LQCNKTPQKGYKTGLIKGCYPVKLHYIDPDKQTVYGSGGGINTARTLELTQDQAERLIGYVNDRPKSLVRQLKE